MDQRAKGKEVEVYNMEQDTTQQAMKRIYMASDFMGKLTAEQSMKIVPMLNAQVIATGEFSLLGRRLQSLSLEFKTLRRDIATLLLRANGNVWFRLSRTFVEQVHWEENERFAGNLTVGSKGICNYLGQEEPKNIDSAFKQSIFRELGKQCFPDKNNKETRSLYEEQRSFLWSLARDKAATELPDLIWTVEKDGERHILVVSSIPIRIGGKFAGILFLMQPFEPLELESNQGPGSQKKSDLIVVFPEPFSLELLGRLHPYPSDKNISELSEKERKREEKYHELLEELSAIAHISAKNMKNAVLIKEWKSNLIGAKEFIDLETEKIGFAKAEIAKFANVRVVQKKRGKEGWIDVWGTRHKKISMAWEEAGLKGHWHKTGPPDLASLAIPVGFFEPFKEDIGKCNKAARIWNELNQVTPRRLPAEIERMLDENLKKWINQTEPVSYYTDDDRGDYWKLEVYHKPVFEDRETYKINGWLFLWSKAQASNKESYEQWQKCRRKEQTITQFPLELQSRESQRQLCREVWEFLNEEKVIPIDVLDALYFTSVTSRFSARLVFRVGEEQDRQGGISRDGLINQIAKERRDEARGNLPENDRIHIAHRLDWHLSLASPYIEIDKKSGKLTCTDRAKYERRYLEGMVSPPDRQTPEEQLEAFEAVIGQLPEEYRQYQTILIKMAEYITKKGYNLYRAVYALHVALATNLTTLYLLALLPLEGPITLEDWERRAEGVCPVGQKFDLWFIGKVDGLERAGTFEKKGGGLALTDYGRKMLEELGLEKSLEKLEKTDPLKGLLNVYRKNKKNARLDGANLVVQEACWTVQKLPDTERDRVVSKNGNLISAIFGAVLLKPKVDNVTESDTPDADEQQPKPEHRPLSDQPTSPLAQIFDAFASLSREDKEKFLNVVAWAKPVELMQERPVATEKMAQQQGFTEYLEEVKKWIEQAESQSVQDVLPVLQKLYDNACERAGLDFHQDFERLTFTQYGRELSKLGKYETGRLENALYVKERFDALLYDQFERIYGIRPKGKISIAEAKRKYVATNKEAPDSFVEKVSTSRNFLFTADDGKQHYAPINPKKNIDLR